MATTIDIGYFNSFFIQSAASSDDWHVEESRIKGEFNGVSVDLGVRAYVIDETFSEETRGNAMIFSGIYNSRTGVNKTNEFSVAENITKAVDSANGTIQRLYAEDTNLLILQEDKVSKALIDKDAIFSAEGGGTVTSTNVVIGQIVPFAGKFGISQNPESFAAYGADKYFADRNRGLIIKLNNQGVIPISELGMRSFFRDELKDAVRISGGYDGYHKMYFVTIAQNDNTYKTLSYDDSVKGWTSLYTYNPKFSFSLNNNYYSIRADLGVTSDFVRTNIWRHYDTTNSGFNQFYGVAPAATTIEFFVNANSNNKNVFKNICYYGTDYWSVETIRTNTDSFNRFLDSGLSIANSKTSIGNAYVADSVFYKKDNKYYADIYNNTNIKEGEIYDPAHFDAAGTTRLQTDVTGVKGNYLKLKFSTGTNTAAHGGEGPQELYSVDTNVSQMYN